MTTAQERIENFGAQLAQRMSRDQAVRTGFGAVNALENAFAEMAVFAIGEATGQRERASAILKASQGEEVQPRNTLNTRKGEK